LSIEPVRRIVVTQTERHMPRVYDEVRVGLAGKIHRVTERTHRAGHASVEAADETVDEVGQEPARGVSAGGNRGQHRQRPLRVDVRDLLVASTNRRLAVTSDPTLSSIHARS
jgi:hypothetical protein